MARRPSRTSKQKAKLALSYADLPADTQSALNELAHESVVFRRSRIEFDNLVASRFKGMVDRETARERFRLAVEAFGKRTPRATAEEKDAQRERVLQHIKAAKDAGNFMALAKFESLYADLMGTREPIKVEHVLTGAIVNVIASLTPEAQAELIARQRRMYVLAQAAEREGLAQALPPAPPVIDAEIVDEKKSA